MSKALSGLGEFAVMSAPLGGLMSEPLNWRAALLVLALFGAASLALALVRFKESLPDDAVQPLHPVALMRNWLHIAGNSTFIAYSGRWWRGRFCRQGAGPYQRSYSSNCVQRNSISVRPLSAWLTVASHTWVVRPRCTARATQRTVPSRALPG